MGWQYACRTASNALIYEAESWFSLDELALQSGDLIELSQVYFTQQAYGPVLVVAYWQADYRQPLYLVSNFELAEEALYWFANAFGLKPSFPTRKVEAFTCIKVTCLTQPAWLGS